MTNADRIAAALTPAQIKALVAVSARTFDTAAELGVPGSALAALARKGLVDIRTPRVQSSNPRARVENEWSAATYRITGYGVIVRGKARRAAEQGE